MARAGESMGRTAYAYIDRAFDVRQLAFGQRAIFVYTDLYVQILGVGKVGCWPKADSRVPNARSLAVILVGFLEP